MPPISKKVQQMRAKAELARRTHLEAKVKASEANLSARKELDSTLAKCRQKSKMNTKMFRLKKQLASANQMIEALQKNSREKQQQQQQIIDSQKAVSLNFVLIFDIAAAA